MSIYVYMYIFVDVEGGAFLNAEWAPLGVNTALNPLRTPATRQGERERERERERG